MTFSELAMYSFSFSNISGQDSKFTFKCEMQNRRELRRQKKYNLLETGSGVNRFYLNVMQMMLMHTVNA